MKKEHIILIVAIILAIAIAGLFRIYQKSNSVTPVIPPVSTTTPTWSDLIVVTSPIAEAKVNSPLHVTGQARGNWYFEASFPVKLTDANHNTLVETPAAAQGDWQTENFVPFVATLSFPAQPVGSTGFLILHNDNPSGDPQFDKAIEIPVKF